MCERMGGPDGEEDQAATRWGEGAGDGCGPLKHPMRVRILEIANTREISPATFVDEGLEPAGFWFPSRPAALSDVAYHFRVLEQAGCIEVVRTRQRRGAIEHIYRGTAAVEFTSEEFAGLSAEQRELFSRTSLQALIARADSAMRTGTFDRRTDRHLVWTAIELDERGWDEFAETLDGCFEEVKRIHADSKDRLAGSGEEVITATYGMLGFPSPTPPPIPGAGESDLADGASE
jgi:hypothetical protein